MILAGCIKEDEDALICDLAEYYHIFNYKELPPNIVATLCVGLRDESRTKMHLSGQRLTLEQLLLARIADSTAFIAYTYTKDAQHNRNKPKSILKLLIDENKEKCEGFDSGDDFETRFKELANAGQR